MFDGVRQEPGMEDAGSWSDRPPRRNQRNQLIRQAWVRGRTVGEGAEAGFRREGTLRQALFREGGYHDVHRMAVLRPEFLGG